MNKLEMILTNTRMFNITFFHIEDSFEDLQVINKIAEQLDDMNYILILLGENDCKRVRWDKERGEASVLFAGTYVLMVQNSDTDMGEIT